MPAYLETLAPDDLMGFIRSNTDPLPTEHRPSERRGYTKSERGSSQLIRSVGVGIVGLAIRHTEYAVKPGWRQSRLGRLLSVPLPDSGEIMLIDFLHPDKSRNIIVTPDRPDPVLVTEGNLPDGPKDDWVVRDPKPEDLDLLNLIIEAVHAHPPMVE